MPSIFLCLEGEAVLTEAAGEPLLLRIGDSAFAAFGSRISLKGPAVLFRASVPGSLQAQASVNNPSAGEGPE
jgi:hypothetical protein